MALGIALSPFPIIPAILLLFTSHPRRSSASFVAGWLLGIAVVTTVGVVLADVADAADETPVWASWARIITGLALVWLGLRQWWERAEPKQQPKWMRSLQEASPGSALRLGVLLSVANPKVALLAVAGGLTIGANSTAPLNEALDVLVFTVVASITVAAPLLSYVVMGERVRTPLERAKAWLELNHAAALAVVVVAIGVYLVVNGYRAL